MEVIKNVWGKLKSPKILWLALFYIFYICLVVATLALVLLKPKQSVFHYILYCISALSTAYFVYTIVIIAPKIKQNLMTFLRKFKFTSTILDNYGYRTLIFSIISFILNLTYVLFIGIFAIISKSVWYMSITIYYLVLILTKGYVFYSKKKYDTKTKQARVFRNCGIMFIFLTLALSGIIVLIYTTNMYFEYAGLLIYVAATFTFYKLVLSIINIFKAKKQDDLYIQSIRNINLASALVSIVVLQVAMFQAFSPENNTSFANALTGAGVSIIILAIGVLMIVIANKKLKGINTINEEK